MSDLHIALNCRGQLLSLQRPVVMGILNVTPDSFFDGGLYSNMDDILKRAEKMLQEGASILDIGGASTRPGADFVPESEEKARVMPAIEAIMKHFPETIISIDTFWSGVAKEAVEAGAALVNDVSAGREDEAMYPTVATLQVPYILMHKKGTPKTMQHNPEYEDVVQEVLDFFIAEIDKLRKLGVKDIVIDPGFGFGKSLEHNYTLLKKMHIFQILDVPVLAGVSRKSMIHKYLGINPKDALNGTTALNMVALQQGAQILRVHDVKEAVEVIKLWEMMYLT